MIDGNNKNILKKERKKIPGSVYGAFGVTVARGPLGSLTLYGLLSVPVRPSTCALSAFRNPRTVAVGEMDKKGKKSCNVEEPG